MRSIEIFSSHRFVNGSIPSAVKIFKICFDYVWLLSCYFFINSIILPIFENFERYLKLHPRSPICNAQNWKTVGFDFQCSVFKSKLITIESSWQFSTNLVNLGRYKIFERKCCWSKSTSFSVRRCFFDSWCCQTFWKAQFIYYHANLVNSG